MGLPFTKLKTISSLPEGTSPFYGFFPYDDGSGNLLKLSTEKFFQIIGNVAVPISPADAAPTTEGWYKPQITSEDNKTVDPNNWGTLYANAGNNRAKAGYDTLFYRTAAGAWKKAESKIGNAPKKVFDPANDEDPSTMKASANRWDKTLQVLESFVSVTKRVETVLTMPMSGETSGAYYNTSFTQVTAAYAACGTIPMSQLADADIIRIEGDMSSMGAPVMYLGKVNANGTKTVVKSGNSTVPFEIAIDHTAQYYVYSRYKDAVTNPNVFKKIKIEPDIKTDAVGAAINPINSVLKSFLHPTQIIWEEITMPYIGEIDGKFRYCGLTYDSEPTWATAMIPKEDLAGYKYLKMTGDFRVGGNSMLYLWRYNNVTSVQVVCGNKDFSEYIMEIDSPYNGIGYSRKKGLHKLYKGKVVDLPVTEDSVQQAILNNSAVAKHRMIDAFTEFNVKASNTAAQNTEGLNQAIQSAYSTRVPIHLPSGIIKHNGITLMPGIHLYGAGMEATHLESASGTNALALLDPNNTNAFWEGNVFKNLTIDGANIADVGINMRHAFGIQLDHVRVRRCKVYGADYEGVLAPRFSFCKFQEGLHGIRIRATTQSIVGYMQANMVDFNNTWFVELKGYGCILDRASLVTFYQCDFERVGTTGDVNTGGIYATNLSPGGSNNSNPEGIDIVMSCCWSESLYGPLATLVNCRGKSKFSDTMGGNQGDTTTVKIINDNSTIKIDGGTKIAFSTTGILTRNNGKTYVDGFSSVNSHIEQTGGTYLTSQYT